MVSNAIPRLSLGISHLTYLAAYTPFTPVIPNNACPLRITAAAGTELAGAYSCGTVRQRTYYFHCGSSHIKGFYTPKSFITHTALLVQAFAH